jgi:endo-1,4-beta-xylanase
MWGASYTQTGSAVSAVNASYDATIGASGGTVNFGFLANDSTLAAPAAFFLNGSICSNN